MAHTLPARSEVDPRFTWDLQSVFPSQAAWETEFEAVGAALPELEGYRGRLAESAATLLAFLEARHALRGRLERLYTYASLPTTADSTNQAARALWGRQQGLMGRWAAAKSFTEPEILAIGRDKLSAFATQEPRLGAYTRYFERLERSRAHVRSAEVETVLGGLVEPFGGVGNVHGSLVDADMTFRPVTGGGEPREVAQGTIDALLADPDREVRQAAFTSYADGYLAFKNTLADLLLTRVRQAVYEARVRGYPSSLAATLEPQEMPLAALDTVIETFRANLPTWHRYWAARRRVLGVERLGPHDVFAPLARSAPVVPYDRAVDTVLAGLAPLGEEYLGPARRGLTEERWVDVYPNAGKTSGAFSSGVQGTHPFILLNHTDDLVSLSTLAHELGHSMHSYLTWETQPPAYADYGMTAAETASNFNQALVRAHLLSSEPAPDFELAVLEEAFSNFHRYFFVMPTLARFERGLHAAVERGEGVTADWMIERMATLFAEGYGEELTMDGPDRERVGITWAQFPHLYAPFYVFQYATGISAAAALAEGVLEGRPGAREGYLAFLRAGDSLPQLSALGLAGVDLATPAPVEQGFRALGRLVDRLERLAESR